MTTLTAWIEHVAADVPGVGPDLLTDAVRDALIEFCERSRAYRYDVPAIDVVGLTATYTPTLPDGTRLWDVISAKHNGKTLDPTTKPWLDAHINRWGEANTTGVPGYYLLTNDRQSVRLVKTPADSLDDGLELELALKPTRAATSVPDFILEDHKYCIQDGAKWKLFSMQKKPWTSPQLAAYHMQEFASACGVAAAFADRDNTRAPLRCAPVR